MISIDRLNEAIETALNRLLSELRPEGFWEGHLSSSALSTATALSALSLAKADVALIGRGVQWLFSHQNADGGWGDTADSPSNLSTTLLAVAALKLSVGVGNSPLSPLEGAQRYIVSRAGATSHDVVASLTRIYGPDRTFAVPILMNCALAGMVPWEVIPGLPFEMAAVPPGLYKVLRLHVVSYALPALIAIGLLIHHRHPPRNPLLRFIRGAVQDRVLGKLQQIQPESGGFLEATPLTSFVAMSLVALFGPTHPVAAKGLEFLRQSQRPDGSWPIDTNLSVWLTTAAVSALASAGRLSRINAVQTAQWLAARQYAHVHPYTNAKAGGWAWTHLSGGVPDVDDTSGAIVALSELQRADGMRIGAEWLLSLQNADGGWPTFCRGWGKLPFDKSAPDLTAHALRALHAADPQRKVRPIQSAVARGFQYLSDTQRPDGSWIPLWFGNQYHPARINPVLGTARVLRAYETDARNGLAHSTRCRRGVAYLLHAQNPDGGWGGDKGIISSMEESALAITALAAFPESPDVPCAVLRGVEYLIQRIEQGGLDQAAPIGLYFASLWYSERLYPIIWSLEALGRARSLVAAASPALQQTR